MTKIELEIISDSDMYLFFKKEFRIFLEDVVKATISI